jgi:hypothetical protein
MQGMRGMKARKPVPRPDRWDPAGFMEKLWVVADGEPVQWPKNGYKYSNIAHHGLILTLIRQIYESDRIKT